MPRFEPRFGWEIDPEPEKQKEHPTPSAFDIITRLLLPLALVYAAYALKDHPYLILVVAILIVLVSFLIVFYRPLLSRIKAQSDAAHDRLIAQENVKRLRQFSKETGEYLDTSTSRSDFLVGLIQEITSRHYVLGNSIRIAPVGILQEHWKFLNHRIQHDELGAPDFHDAVNELTSILQSFNTHCVYPIFRISAAELREKLTAEEKSKFNAFQQRYVTFITTYGKYVSEVGDEFRTLPKLYAGMAMPEPL